MGTYVPPHARKEAQGSSTLAASLPRRETPFSSSHQPRNEQLSAKAVKEGRIELPINVLMKPSAIEQRAELPTLQALAFSSLAGLLPDLFESLEAAKLPLSDFILLPAELHIALLALAKRLGLLSNRTVRLLTSPGLPLLDLGLSPHQTKHVYTHTPSTVTALPFLEALRRLEGSLLTVDVRRLDGLTKPCYLALASLPHLQTLYVGGSTVTSSEFAKILDDVIESRRVAPLVPPDESSWEALLDPSSSPATAPRLFPSLRRLIWAGCPPPLADLWRKSLPSIEIVTADPDASHPVSPTGDAYLDRFVTPSLRAAFERRETFDQMEWSELPPAERFRLAFVLRDLKQRQARLKQAQKRRGQVEAVLDLEEEGTGASTQKTVQKYLDELKL